MTATNVIDEVTTEEVQNLLQMYRAPVPTIRDFVTDPYYMGGQVVPHENMMQVLSDVFDDPKHNYNLVGLHMGIGWGKSYLVNISLAYILYRTLCLQSPQEYYGLSANTPIEFVNFSVRATQAHEVLFQALRNMVDNSPAFQEPGFKRDVNVKLHLRWPDRGIRVRSGTSKSTSALGYNLLCAAIDEASWFQLDAGPVTKAGASYAGEIDDVRALANAIMERMKSRGNVRWRRDVSVLAISSPRSINDWLEEVATLSTRLPNVYFSRQPTWEGYIRNSLSGETFYDEVCGNVPIEYKEEFDSNPQRSRRNLGARPLEALSRYFADNAALERCYDDLLMSCFMADPREWSVVEMLDKPQKTSYPRFAHVDLGLKRDRLGLAIGHYDPVLGLIVLDGVTFLHASDPPFRKLGEIELDFVRRAFRRLVTKGMNIVKVTFDGWQSVDSRQILSKEGIATDLLSVDRNIEPYDTLHSVIRRGLLKMKRTLRSSMFMHEMKGLELVNGKKVDHPPGGSKDVSDAVCGVVFQLAPQLGATGRVVGLENEFQTRVPSPLFRDELPTFTDRIPTFTPAMR